jgi:hypothetical protein
VLGGYSPAVEFTVEVTPERAGLYRLINDGDGVAECLLSNHERGRPRRWKQLREDAARHRGLSMWATPGIALDKADSVNRPRAGRGADPAFTHIALVGIDGLVGHAWTEFGSPGHFTVWAEAEGESGLGVAWVLPIEEFRARMNAGELDE